MSDQEDVPKSGRKSLKTLQRAASEQENLVGRPHNLKHQLSRDSPVEVQVKRKVLSTCTKETQTDPDIGISEDDLTDAERASENYWQIVAEKRRIALENALEENERLHQIIEKLKEENAQIRTMLEEANSFVEVIKEELANVNDDTGIDVNDVSTADETLNDTRDDISPAAKK